VSAAPDIAVEIGGFPENFFCHFTASGLGCRRERAKHGMVPLRALRITVPGFDR
jgi:hypothetical protein